MAGERTILNSLRELPLLEDITVFYKCCHAAVDLGTIFPTGLCQLEVISQVTFEMKGIYINWRSLCKDRKAWTDAIDKVVEMHT